MAKQNTEGTIAAVPASRVIDQKQVGSSIQSAHATATRERCVASARALSPGQE